MKLNSINLGKIVLQNNVVCAPLAGYSDYAFRSLCYKLGAALSVSEMISAKGLSYNNRNTADMLKTYENESVKAVQIFGRDPKIMGEVCKSEYLEKFDIIDINMGCPVHKVFSNGEGSALLDEPELVGKIVKSCVESGKIVTVKMRVGISENRLIAPLIAKICEDNGAKMLTVHGRTREGMYSGPVHYEEIEKVKNSVSIPVIANGGIFTQEDADLMIERTGADGVALARGIMQDPLLISQLTGVNSGMDKKQALFYVMDKRLETQPEIIVAHGVRSFASFLLKGVRGGKEVKLKLNECDTVSGIKQLFNSVM